MYNGKIVSSTMLNNPPAKGMYMETVFNTDRVYTIYRRLTRNCKKSR
jgi:hypothetical protein